MVRTTRSLHLLSSILTAAFVASAFSTPSLGQETEVSSGYRSQVDQDLTIRKISLLPVSDNVGGIYARPIEAELNRLIRESHHYNFIDAAQVGTVPITDELEEDPGKIQALGKGLGTDAILAVKVSKGPRGVSVTLDLFLVNDGKLIAQESLRDFPRFEIPELKDKTTILYRKIMSRVPYDGLILSRNGTKVTLSLGKRDGVQVGQIVNAILILQVQRHPKFNFIISSEKEILGKIRLTKVEDSLSFGNILTEKDKGSIRKLTKVAGLETVNYPDVSAPASATDTGNQPNSGDMKEWIPVPPPTFGLVGFRVGLGSYTHSTSIEGVGGLEGKTAVYPSISLLGELWLTPRWVLRGNLRQGIVSFKNPRESSSPTDLSVAISSYGFYFGYNFLMRDDFWGPKIVLLGGVYQYNAAVDDSQPTVFTSMTYQGMSFGLEGMLPLDEKKIWSMGAGLNMMFQPTLSESPVTSGGNNKHTINQFYVFGRKKVAENIHAVGTIEVETYATSFAGDGSRTENVTTDSQSSTILSGGINYMF